jgi:Sulfotransferase family
VTDSIDELVAKARAETGLDDLGEDTWSEGLRALTTAADRDGRFNEFGRAGFEAEIVRNLRNRLLVEHWYARHPEIDDQEVEVELLGVGFPRTGSTALAAMLGEDPTVRNLRMWEAATPCPPPGVSADDDAARLAAAEQVLVLQDQLEPRLKSMLPQSATGPFEDHDLVALSFASQHFLATAWVPSYADWYLQCDMVPAYRY